jgi:hypothetical protein
MPRPGMDIALRAMLQRSLIYRMLGVLRHAASRDGYRASRDAY